MTFDQTVKSHERDRRFNMLEQILVGEVVQLRRDLLRAAQIPGIMTHLGSEGFAINHSNVASAGSG
jgi:hypothetical protein